LVILVSPLPWGKTLLYVTWGILSVDRLTASVKLLSGSGDCSTVEAWICSLEEFLVTLRIVY